MFFERLKNERNGCLSFYFNFFLYYQLKSLLELLEEKSNVGDEASLTLGAIRCLCDLNHHVLVRLMAVCDLVLFCPEQGLALCSVLSSLKRSFSYGTLYLKYKFPINFIMMFMLKVRIFLIFSIICLIPFWVILLFPLSNFLKKVTKLLSCKTCFNRNFCHLQLITAPSIES